METRMTACASSFDYKMSIVNSAWKNRNNSSITVSEFFSLLK